MICIIITKNQLASAHDLHSFLEVKKDFTTWIKNRIIKYKFEENQDFQIISNFDQNGKKSGKSKDNYILLLDIVKELCIIETDTTRRKARKYFIKCEKKYSQSLKNKSLSLGFEKLFNSIEWNKLQSYNRAISNIQNVISEETYL